MLALWGIGGFLLVVAFRVVAGYGITFYWNYESISAGDSKEHVIDQLGPPDDKSVEFRLGQRQGFEVEYQRAAKSNSSYYFVWYKGIDVVYCIGFDENHRVAVKGVGGT